MIDEEKIKAEVYNEFYNDTTPLSDKMKIVNKAIKVLSIVEFFSRELSVFLYTFLPTLFMIIYSFLNEYNTTSKATYISLVLVGLHFVLYKTLFRGIVKKSKILNQEWSYQLKALKKIKSDNFKKN